MFSNANLIFIRRRERIRKLIYIVFSTDLTKYFPGDVMLLSIIIITIIQYMGTYPVYIYILRLCGSLLYSCTQCCPYVLFNNRTNDQIILFIVKCLARHLNSPQQRPCVLVNQPGLTSQSIENRKSLSESEGSVLKQHQ